MGGAPAMGPERTCCFSQLSALPKARTMRRQPSVSWEVGPGQTWELRCLDLICSASRSRSKCGISASSELLLQLHRPTRILLPSGGAPIHPTPPGFEWYCFPYISWQKMVSIAFLVLGKHLSVLTWVRLSLCAHRAPACPSKAVFPFLVHLL